MNLRAVLVVAWICAVGCGVCWGQPSPEPLPPGLPASFGLAPEDAYLSPTRYTNAYFGFSFDFPEGVSMRPVPQPASNDGRIQLLDLVGTAGNWAAVSISAYEYKNKNYTDAKSLLRRELDQEVIYGVEQVRGPAKTSVGDHPFYWYEIRKGVEQRAVLAAVISGYVVEVVLRSRNVDMLHELYAAFLRAQFFQARDAAHRAGALATVYQGPAISEGHLNEVRESKPAEHIDPGKIDGQLYSNSQIGVRYEFPQGWNVESEGAIEPAVERYREQITGEPLLGRRERAVVKACRKTLLSVWRSKPGADGEVPYEEFGEVTLLAMPLSCFPNIRFPSDAKDATAVKDFVAGLMFTQPLQRDMTEARTYEAGGRPFVLTHGMIGYRERGDTLSRRISVSLAMTTQRGYLLIWLFAAPHEAELRELMAAKVGFDAETAPAAEEASHPGGGEPVVPAPAATGQLPLQPTAVTQGQPPYRPSLQSGADEEPGQTGQGKLQTDNSSPH